MRFLPLSLPAKTYNFLNPMTRPRSKLLSSRRTAVILSYPGLEGTIRTQGWR